MSCELCRAALSHPDDQEIAAKLHAACMDVCGCERYTLSDLSPGPVHDEELLNLIISDPQGIKDGKTPHPGILVQIDQAGLSVLRDAASNEEFEITIRELKERSEQKGGERYFFGICAFKARSIRVSGDRRFLCVYDTALDNKPNHADVFGPDLKAMALPEQISKGEHKRRNMARIKKFIEQMGECFVPARMFRDGAFAKYSRNASRTAR
jgi:hypothetical protein